MKTKIEFYLLLVGCIFVINVTGCSGQSEGKSPEYISNIQLNENYGVTDWGHSGEKTPDGNYYYYGQVILYSDNGQQRTFDCYLGTEGMEKGCRGVIYYGQFYNLDRNKWITIAGVRYRASGY